MKKTASAFCSDTVLGLIKGMCVWYPHSFTLSLFCLRLKSPQDSERLTVLQQSSHCVRREMHWAHPKLSKRQTVHLPCKQSPDIAAHVIPNGRHLLCVPDKGTHLTVTWFDVHTHAFANIRSNVSIYKHGRTSHADTQRDTKRISRSVSLPHLVA